MSSTTKFEEFDPAIITWDRYVRRVKNHLLINKIKPDMQLPTVLNLLSSTTYSILCDLIAPMEPESLDLYKVLEVLTKHFSPRVLTHVERFNFGQRKQNVGESVADFILALRKLSINCDFGIVLEDRLCEQFVLGLRDVRCQRMVLAEEKLSLNIALRVSSAVELSAKGAKTINSSITTVENEVFRHEASNVRPSETNLTSQVTKKSGLPCKHCGEFLHKAEDCRYKNATCYKCGKFGHTSRCCRSAVSPATTLQTSDGSPVNNRASKSRRSRKPCHVISDTEEQTETYEMSRMSLFKINKTSAIPPIMIKLFVNGVGCLFELDTGAAVSVMSSEIFFKLFPKHKLLPSDITLSTLSDSIKPIGKVIVTINYKGKNFADLVLVIIKEGNIALLGRSWFSSLGMLDTFNNIYSVSVDTNNDLNMILGKYPQLFSDKLGELKNFEARLSLKENAAPKFFKFRTVPFALRDAVDVELDKLLRQGIIIPVQYSDWSAPIVPIIKKNKSIRLCGDYKVGLNPCLVVDRYPLPKIDDIFAQLNGGIIFSKLDMNQAYQQIKMDESSQKLLTINTHRGLFTVTKMPFGIASAPGIFQKAMDQLLSGLKGVICYLDDILVTGSSLKDHLYNLDCLLHRLAESGITLNKDKCEFLKKELEYLGHVLDGEGLHTSPRKITDVIQAPIPKDVSQLRSFLGLVGYYRKFLPKLASTLTPLNDLLQKDTKWNWNSACDYAFKKVKEEITSPHVLTHFDPKLPISLACDASPTGVGAVISHTYADGSERPIAFASRSLSSTERNYAQIDKEAVGIIFGIKKFHQYLFGRKFTLLTDHKPLTRIFGPNTEIPTLAATRLQRWALILSAYNYDIVYRASKDHGNADALSRSPKPAIFKIVLAEDELPLDIFMFDKLDSFPVTHKTIAKQTLRDPILAQVLRFSRDNWPTCSPSDDLLPFFKRKEEISIQEGCLLWGLRVLIPHSLRSSLLKELHTHHTGTVRMKMLARGYFWWPKLDDEINNITKSCYECCLHANSPAKAPLHPWSWPTKPWQRLHLDFAGPFMGHTFLVAVDAHSKWAEVFTMNSTSTPSTLEMLNNLLAHYGLPNHIVTDNGSQFTSKEFQEYCKLHGIRHTFSAPYHPATNGQAERFVQILKRNLKKSAPDLPIQQKLNKLLFAYRSTPHIATHQTPSFLFLGREMRTRLDLLRPSVENHVHAQQYYSTKSHVNEEKARVFPIGQPVVVRDHLGSQKWCPGTITSQTGPVSYEVLLNDGRTWKRHLDHILPTNSPITIKASCGPATQLASEDDNSQQHQTTPNAVSVVPPFTPGLPTTSSAQARRSSSCNRRLPNRLTF